MHQGISYRHRTYWMRGSLQYTRGSLYRQRRPLGKMRPLFSPINLRPCDALSHADPHHADTLQPIYMTLRAPPPNVPAFATSLVSLAAPP